MAPSTAHWYSQQFRLSGSFAALRDRSHLERILLPVSELRRLPMRETRRRHERHVPLMPLAIPEKATTQKSPGGLGDLCISAARYEAAASRRKSGGSIARQQTDP